MRSVPVICRLLECMLDLHQKNQIPCLLGVQCCTAAMTAVLLFFMRNSNLLPVPVECEQEIIVLNFGKLAELLAGIFHVS